MRTILLQVNRAETDESVALSTAYHGVKNDAAATLYDRVAVVESDVLWLDRAWEECCALADTMLGEYLSADGLKPHGPRRTCYRASLRMPDNWEYSLAPSLEALLRSFFVARITAEWMAVTMPEQENHYSAKADLLAGECRRLLHERRRPVRPGSFF